MPNTHELRPELPLRDGHVRPARARSRCSTCSATRTRTATAGATCPTARRWCWSYDTLSSRRLSRARRDHEEEPRRGRHQDQLPHRQVARAAARVARRQADDVGLRPVRQLARQRQRARHWPTASPAGQQNHSRFKNAKFDELYEKQRLMPDGPERDAVIREAVRILVAYMPIQVPRAPHRHRPDAALAGRLQAPSVRPRVLVATSTSTRPSFPRSENTPCT